MFYISFCTQSSISGRRDPPCFLMLTQSLIKYRCKTLRLLRTTGHSGRPSAPFSGLQIVLTLQPAYAHAQALIGCVLPAAAHYPLLNEPKSLDRLHFSQSLNLWVLSRFGLVPYPKRRAFRREWGDRKST